MRSSFVLGGVVCLGMAAVGASCIHQSPESFCQGWVESTCQAISTCCRGGTRFDMDGCRLGLSRSCQGTTAASKVESGELRFDSGAASDCLGSISSCAEFTSAQEDMSYAHQQACANAVTGYTPTGAACQSAQECARAGDFSICYNLGAMGGTGTGVCAQVVLGTTTCSFSFSTGEFQDCPDGTFCDRPVTPMNAPTQQQFEFTAPCKPIPTAGAACVGPCADGLVCQPTAKGTLTCQPLPGQNGPFCFTP